MNRHLFVWFSAIALFLVSALPARADLITRPFGPSTVIDFDQFAGLGYNFTFGPAQIGDRVGLDVVFTGAPAGGGNSGSGSVLGSGIYGLAGNGTWGEDRIYSGLDSRSGFMTYTFNFGAVSSVGGFINYAPFDFGPVRIEALDASGRVLEAYALQDVAPISTPGALNAGAFRGIRRNSPDITSFRLANAYAVLDDLTFGTAPVPEPSTLVLFGTAAAYAARRRPQKRSSPPFRTRLPPA